MCRSPLPLRSLFRFGVLPVATLLLGLLGCEAKQPERSHHEWTARGGGPNSIRYSSLDQIDTSNVDQLEVAWTYNSGDATDQSQIQANPIVVDTTLYATSPALKVVAVDAATGTEQWTFDPFQDTSTVNLQLNVNRGVTYWRSDDEERILFTAGPTLYALHPEDGSLIETFGTNGRVSLKTGLGPRADNLYVSATSPGVLYEDLIIIGSRVSEGADAAPGHIRAFDVRTGDLEWTFHTIPRPGEFGYQTWNDSTAWKRVGGANSWPGMSVDRDRGIVYAPTGSASPDFYGGSRKGKNLFANTLLALDANTGERIWHYQTVHHDLWDRDLPSPPSLVTIHHEGTEIDAVAQTTKTGYVFLFHRETGEPLFPIEEVPVPTESPLQGEQPWPTQPRPTTPEPFMRQKMTVDDINPYVPDSVKSDLKAQLRQLNHDHMFEPPSLQGTLMFPGFDGGAEWGGNAVDPMSDILYVNGNEVPWIMTMLPSGQRSVDDSPGQGMGAFAAGRSVYRTHCTSCHGPDREGDGPVPSIAGVADRYNATQLIDIIRNGRRRMPAFDYLSTGETKALANFLLNREAFDIDADTVDSAPNSKGETPPYTMAGYEKFRTPRDYPAVSPPWGTLNAIDLSTGDFVWRRPLGTYPELSERGISPTGTENYGGPVVTAGGLVFIAATLDKKIRAFDKATGDLLWSHELPAAGFATPSIYQVDGTQYVVIACGGGKLGTESGDAYVAFALPDAQE